MTYENVSWNSDHFYKLIEGGLSKNDFVNQGLKEGHYEKFTISDQKKMLREVYQLIKERLTPLH